MEGAGLVADAGVVGGCCGGGDDINAELYKLAAADALPLYMPE